jgi:thiol:disulfide interchange protein DsbD
MSGTGMSGGALRRGLRTAGLALGLWLLSVCLLGAGLALADEAAPRVPEEARAEGAIDGEEPRVEARLLVHPDDDPRGSSLRVAVLLEVDPGWHVYGPDPGDSGLPTELRWNVEGARVGPVAWPPTEPRVLLPVEVTPLDDRAGPRPARVEVDLLACAHSCIPATLSLERDLHAARPAWSTGATRAETTALFARLAAGDRSPNAPPPAGDETGALGLARALLLGLLGGIVLNAMPCVLPVLAIKLFALSELRERSRREVLEHAAAYTGGILVTMLALAAALALLRAAGASVGWGFQLQDPRFALAIATLLVLFALNLFGAFEITPPTTRLAHVGASASGLPRSFFDGLLAVLLATPCTAPFLGTAAGFALAGSVGVIFAVFAAIGLGLALPFVLVALLPGGSRLMPRAGSWMLELRRVLGFALLGTVVWLLWVLRRSVPSDQLVALVAFLLSVALAGFVYGVGQRMGRARSGPIVGSALAVLGFVLFAPTTAEPVGAPAAHVAPDTPWQRFDPDAVAARLEQSQPVLVYFTADWCITCKLNERLVLADERVLAELSRRDFALFRADWTLRDETIRREIERLGRAGVPTSVVYHPGDPERPEVLPELLTVERLLESLRSGEST